MKNTYNISLFGEKDISLYAPIYSSAFSSTPDLDIVRNKFFHEYQNTNPSFIVIAENGQPASFYGVIIQYAQYGQTTFPIAQSCDSMTHKAHGGQGLFVKAAEATYAFLKTKGINYVYGFPNKTIYDLRKVKLQWEYRELIHVFRHKVKTLPFVKLVKKFPSLKKAYLGYLNILFKKYKSHKTHFANSVLVQGIAGIIHNEAYFHYKSGVDKFILNINGINFWVKIDGNMWVGDFENTSVENFRVAFKKLQKITKKAGITDIVFHYQEGTANESLLRQTMPIHSTMPLGFRNLSEEHKDKIFKFSGSDFDTW